MKNLEKQIKIIQTLQEELNYWNTVNREEGKNVELILNELYKKIFIIIQENRLYLPTSGIVEVYEEVPFINTINPDKIQYKFKDDCIICILENHKKIIIKLYEIKKRFTVL